MRDEVIPKEVSELLDARIEAYEELEALLLLHGNSSAGLSAATVATTLGISEADALDALEGLATRGLVRCHESERLMLYAFAPVTPEIRGAVDRLQDLYSERRLEIVRLMNAKAISRVRDAAVRAFADAFLLGRKKKKDG